MWVIFVVREAFGSRMARMARMFRIRGICLRGILSHVRVACAGQASCYGVLSKKIAIVNDDCGLRE